jgi:N-acetylmuramoyl-L-alanine amidase
MNRKFSIKISKKLCYFCKSLTKLVDFFNSLTIFVKMNMQKFCHHIFQYIIICVFTIGHAEYVRAQAPSGEYKIRKVVIDAGHGGYEPGVVGKLVKEKDVVLSIALKTGALLKEKYPEVEVIYTRDNDVFVPLHERTNIANKCNADLFISIHANSVVNRKNTSAGGSETYIMGVDDSDRNMEVAKRENAVITYEEDYAVKYEGYNPNSPETFIIFSLMQNSFFEQSLLFASMVQEQLPLSPIKKSRGVKQQPLLVLWHTTMPSVLIEVGFLSNPEEEALLKKEETRNDIALRIVTAFTNYKAHSERKHKQTGETTAPESVPAKTQRGEASAIVTQPATTPAETTQQPAKSSSKPLPPASTAPKPARSTHYAVQIVTLSTQKPVTGAEFKNLDNVRCFPQGKLFRYTVGTYDTRQQAQTACSQLRSRYPGAFVVFIQNNKIIQSQK